MNISWFRLIIKSIFFQKKLRRMIEILREDDKRILTNNLNKAFEEKLMFLEYNKPKILAKNRLLPVVYIPSVSFKTIVEHPEMFSANRREKELHSDYFESNLSFIDVPLDIIKIKLAGHLAEKLIENNFFEFEFHHNMMFAYINFYE